EDSRKRPIGTAIAAATNPLKRIPNFMNSPRRVVSFDIVSLLVRLAWNCSPPRREPGDYVRDLLVGHRFAANVAAPIGCSQFGTAGDDVRPQPLVADQREEGVVGDGAAFWCAAAIRAVTGCAVGLVRCFPTLRVAWECCCVGWRVGAVQNSGLAPSRPDSLGNHV